MLLGRRHDHPAVAEPAQVLRGEERERGEIRVGADHPPPVPRAERLRRILDHGNAELATELGEPIEVDGQAEEVDRDDRP